MNCYNRKCEAHCVDHRCYFGTMYCIYRVELEFGFVDGAGI